MITKNKEELYTLGIWIVKKGKEKVFIAAWREFAKWSLKKQLGNTMATLLQDEVCPQQFISFGPWKNHKCIQVWRNQPEFKDFIQKARHLCEDIKPHTLKSVVTLPRLD
jgi:quinol monooxygenase YgiN